jgi:Flp pilus assembly protein TadG
MTYFLDGNLPTVLELLMRQRIPLRKRTLRPGSSAVELALLLPLLGMLFLVTVDFARLYYHYTIITNCARNGALYASDPVAAAESPYLTLQAAAQADAKLNNLNPLPSVNSTNGTDSAGNPYVEVTVSYSFATISNYPGLSNPINLTRTVRMRVVPTTPN